MTYFDVDYWSHRNISLLLLHNLSASFFVLNIFTDQMINLGKQQLNGLFSFLIGSHTSIKLLEYPGSWKWSFLNSVCKVSLYKMVQQKIQRICALIFWKSDIGRSLQEYIAQKYPLIRMPRQSLDTFSWQMD